MNSQKYYSVLVGGKKVNDYSLTLYQAKCLAFEYLADGYDDIEITEVLS